jgi:pimeloyl-ACP methyl ester carboxylesterase
MQNQFKYKNSIVSYHRIGTGSEVLVAFHGYGQTGEAYAYFEDVLGERFTIIAIDFFWHGSSEWHEPFDFTDLHMKELLDGIARQENLHAQRFSVLSFSMGARLARALVRNFAARIDYFILLSPPTFSFNRFLNFTTNNPIGLAAFKYFANTPGALLNWVERLHKIKILNRSVYVFTSKFVGKQERIQKVFKTWLAQRKLTTNFSKFAKLLDHHNIKVVLIVGKKDAITPPYQMIKYVRKLKNKRIFILQKKHELATPETKHIFTKLFSVGNELN